MWSIISYQSSTLYVVLRRVNTSKIFVYNTQQDICPSLWPRGIGTRLRRTGCEFESWQCRIHIQCSKSLRLLWSLQGSLGTLNWLDTKIVLKNRGNVSHCLMFSCRPSSKRPSEVFGFPNPSFSLEFEEFSQK